MRKSEINVLFVEDVGIVQDQVREALAAAGLANVFMAKTVAHAQSLLLAKPIHLVICDWHILPVSGFEFLRFVKRSPRHFKVPFIMLTAERTTDCVVQAISGGADAYVLKPFHTLQFLNKIFEVMMQKGLMSDAEVRE